MEQIKLSLKQFKEQVENKLNGIYVYIANDCPLCYDLLNRMKTSNIVKSVYVVDCLQDIPYFQKEFGLDGLPYTIVYKDGKEVYEKAGVLYNKQLTDLRKHYNDSLHSTDT